MKRDPRSHRLGGEEDGITAGPTHGAVDGDGPDLITT
jgi:hypothetical protein